MRGFSVLKKSLLSVALISTMAFSYEVKDVFYSKSGQEITLQVDGVIEVVQYKKPDLYYKKVDKDKIVVKPLEDGKVYQFPVVYSFGKTGVDTVVFLIKKMDKEAFTLKRIGVVGDKVIYKDLKTGKIIYKDKNISEGKGYER